MKKNDFSLPLVSVIVPVYNAGKYIDECLKSLLDQTYKNIEIILCDDASTDDSYSKLCEYKKYLNIVILKNEKNMHQAYTRNKCIKNSRGDFIVIQDADDISNKERIEKLISVLNVERDVAFVGSGCFLFDTAGSYDKIIPKVKYPGKEDLLWGIPFVHASMMFRKECLEKIGGYRIDKLTKRGEDYDLIMNLYANGYRGGNIPDLLYGYRVDQDTYRRRTFLARLDECCIRFRGYKSNKILFPIGIFYIFKPILAYFYQEKKINKLKKRRSW